MHAPRPSLLPAALHLSLAALACACGGGGASAGASEPAGGADLDAMTWTAATRAHPAELCERMAAIMGPRVERDCPSGGHEARGIDPSACHAANQEGADMPSLPADCTATVAEVEGCFRAIAALPECPGLAAMEVMFGPPCAPINDCARRPARGEGDEPGAAPAEAAPPG